MPTCWDSIAPSDSLELGLELVMTTVEKDRKLPIKETLALLNVLGVELGGIPMPTVLRSPRYDFAREGTVIMDPNGSTRLQVAPSLSGKVKFRISKGVPSDIDLVVSSADRRIDSSLMSSVRKLANPQYRSLLEQWNFREPVLLNLQSLKGRAPDYTDVVVTYTTPVEHRFATAKVPLYTLSRPAKLLAASRLRPPADYQEIGDGALFLQMVVDENGNIIPETVEFSRAFLAHPRLIKSFRKSLGEWEYRPAKIENCSVKTFESQIVNFGAQQRIGF